jgi:Flp pilus assembly protein TadG
MFRRRNWSSRGGRRRSWPLTIRAARGARGGVAGAEFALVAPVFVLLLLSVYDIGNAVHQRLLLQQALSAGGQYAVSFPTQTGNLGSTNDGILAAVQQALPAGHVLDVSLLPVTSQRGDAGTHYYITLSATLSISPFLLPIPKKSTLIYVVRVQ